MTDLSKHRPDFEAEFTPERREALYAEITDARGSAPAGRGRLLVGLGVAAVAVTALALALPGLIQATWPSAPVAQPRIADGEAETSPTTFEETLPPMEAAASPTATSRRPGTLTWQLGREVTPSVLEEVAVLSSGVGQPAAGQYLHIVEVSGERGPNNEVIPGTIDESYIDADGWTWRRRSYGAGVSNQVEWQKLAPRTDRDRLPTDPAALDAHFRNQTGTNSPDRLVFKSASELLSPYTTPELRMAALQVLARLAVSPQTSGVDEEGTVTNPKVTLNEITFSDGTLGYRAHFEDPTSRPDDGSSIFINAYGIVIGGEHDTREDATWAAEVTVNEIVAALPEDFSRRLGAEQVRFEKTVIDEG